MDFDLGFFDQEEGRVELAPNPFEPTNVLTISPGPCEVAEGQGFEPWDELPSLVFKTRQGVPALPSPPKSPDCTRSLFE